MQRSQSGNSGVYNCISLKIYWLQVAFRDWLKEIRCRWHARAHTHTHRIEEERAKGVIESSIRVLFTYQYCKSLLFKAIISFSCIRYVISKCYLPIRNEQDFAICPFNKNYLDGTLDLVDAINSETSLFFSYFASCFLCQNKRYLQIYSYYIFTIFTLLYDFIWSNFC